MAIPKFQLPSDPSITVQFREPTVDDCIEFCGLNESLPEKACTQYLNHVQAAPVSDCLNWTASDRRTALWWIFVCTAADTLLPFQYHCNECNETHYVDIDLLDLDAEACSLNGKDYISQSLSFAGELVKVRLHTLTGAGMERLETSRIIMEQLDAGSPEYLRAKAEYRVLEVALSFSIDSHESLAKSFDEALNEKMVMIKAMSRTNEFHALVVACESAQQALRHGLNYTMVDGEYFINSPGIRCENDKEGKTALKRLMFPFHGVEYIPAI